MAKTSPVAVIIPVYNRRLKLIKTLETVAAQSELPTLVIVVDDGSTDKSAEAAENWLAANAAFEWRVIGQANAGVSVARNAGFASIGDLPYVCFLDSDDLWPPNFIAEAMRALDGREDIVAAVANRVRKRGQRVQNFSSVASNPLLWILFNGGAILSCTMIRSSSARAAGLFDPTMLVRQDSDFFLRLFSLGGAAHSRADPVVFIKGAPLEPTEAPNSSQPSLEFKYEGALNLTASVSKLPKDVLKNHALLIRTAVARRWASVAFSSLRAGRQGLAFSCLLRAVWWDHEWKRRLRLILSFARGQKLATYFPNPFEVS